MSAIAFVLLKQGHKVSGSDAKRSRIVEKLESLGGKFHLGHHEKNIEGADIVVFSSSITPENPELKAARNRKVATLHRADMLALIMNDKKGIAVTGAHGKTTTSSLIAHILYRAGLDPTAILGGEVRSLEGNARVGGGEHFVVEADESDGSFVHLKPFYGVITNIDAEHLDYYRNMGEIISWYLKFAGKIKPGGKLFACGDCDNLRRALRGYPCEVVTFGLSKDHHIYPENVKMHDSRSEFEVIYRGKRLGPAVINIPGIHNVSNAMAAFAVALELGLDFDTIKKAADDFTGAARRFQVKYSANGIKVIDDYAHHPAEIKATTEAARNWNPKRLVVVFQPHRFSRTKYLKERFGSCFDMADRLILTDVYAASEDELDNVSGKSIYEEVKKHGLKDTIYMPKKELKGYLLNNIKRGDMVLMMGAGDITAIAEELAQELANFPSPLSSPHRGEGRVRGMDLNFIKGTVKFDEPLSRHTSFKIGGPADIFVYPADEDDLLNVLRYSADHKMDAFMIGGGGKLLVGDKGFRGFVISLNAPAFTKLIFDGESVDGGCGIKIQELIKRAAEQNLGGLEFLAGIPGTLGGVVMMNAGWPAKAVGDFVEEITAVRGLEKIKLGKGAFKFSYRSSNLEGAILISARLRLEKKPKDRIEAEMNKNLEKKRQTQELGYPSAGSIFLNPSGSSPAWELIDGCGLRGEAAGGAAVSEKHANFIVNRGKATASDVRKLIDGIQKKVFKEHQIMLKLEVKLIGEF